MAGEGIHLAIDLSQGSALSWVAGELAVALSDIGQLVSIPHTNALSKSLEPRLLNRLSSLMTTEPYSTYHIKLNHYWPQFLMQEVSGEINAELFVTNYRFRGELHPIDMWSRNLVTNGLRKLPMSSFCRDSLADLGVSASQCSVVAPGYSPEIESIFPEGKPRADSRVRKLLIVTNSHDLNRYGTDILIPAISKAFSANDAVEIHIKDYGSSSNSHELRNLVASQPSFPDVVWHEKFLSKEDLIRLYGEMHLMVSPFRGEGYAMKIIDAMAVGLPVMMPAFGGPMEYAPPGGFLPLEFEEVPVGKCYDTDHYLVGPGAYWCQIHEDTLVASLRSFIADPQAADNAAQTARAHIYGRYTWSNTAQSLVAALRHWHAKKETAISRRRQAATLPLSIIMPTKNRPSELAKTLHGYTHQTAQSFELVIVNDHGDGDEVRQIVATVGNRLRTRVIDNNGPPGPGAARNLGLDASHGEVYLVTGDDIIPAPDLIARHLDAHRRYPAAEDAFVGKVDWHPEMELRWFTRHIVGAGSQQFDYTGLVDEQLVSFQQFYTSNVSWKRRLTANSEQVFSEAFRFAAYEDVELGYRLSKQGLALRYLEKALGHHLHPMTEISFWERMRRVGRMRCVLTAMHPSLVGTDDLDFYHNLELERRRRKECPTTRNSISWEKIVDAARAQFEALDDWAPSETPSTTAAADQIQTLERRVDAVRQLLFDDICDFYRRVGQAEEWSRDSSEQDWPATFAAMLRLPSQPAPKPKKRNRMAGYLPYSSPIRKWIRGVKQRFLRHDVAMS